jgi:adenosine deaminase
MEPMSFYQQLPKAELHAHLHGSVRPATLLELGLAHPMTTALPELSKAFEYFSAVHALVTSYSILRRIALEAVEDCSADGVVHLELRTTPKSRPALGITKRGYVETVLRALNDASEKHNMSVGLILSINRTEPLAEATDTVRLACEFSTQGVVGVDLSGDPTAGSFATFLPALQQARSHGMPITVHFAEVQNTEEAWQILQFAPERLGHACFMDSPIAEELRKRRIPVEVCLTSNLKTGSVQSVAEHHLRQLAASCHPLSLATDDSGLFATTLSNEYYLAHQHLEMSNDQLIHIARQGFEQAFLDSKRRGDLLAKFDAWHAEARISRRG